MFVGFFFSSRRRHTRWTGDWSSDVCSSDLLIDTSVAQSSEAEQAGRFAEAAGKLKQAIGLGRESAAGWWKLSELEEKAGALEDAASAAFLGAQSAYGEQRGKALLRVGQLLDKANR